MIGILRDFFISFAIFMLIDMIWLIFIARSLYQKYLGYLMSNAVSWPAALVFYVLFIIGLMFFVIQPALQKNALSYAFLAGALFGLVTYATYDLTNLATIRDWPLFITIIDLIWGATVSALTSGLSFILINRFFE